MNIKDRIKVFFNIGVNEVLRKYAEAFLKGEDMDCATGGISRDTAMQYSAVFACVRVLSETLASLPLKVYRKTDEGRAEDTGLPLHDLVTYKVNDELAPFNWKEFIMTSLCLGGNAFQEKVLSPYGEVIALIPLDYTRMSIERDAATKALVYKYMDGKTYSRTNLFHIPGLSFDGVAGLTPISYAARAINLGLLYESFGVNFYSNAAIPSGTIEAAESIRDAAFVRFKEEFKKNYTGMVKMGVPMILEAGMKYNPLKINQADAQFIESKKFQLADIARIFRVPLHLLQDLDKATNNNIEHQSLEFVMYTMLPWCKRIEENMNMQLLTDAQRREKGYFVEFLMSGLLRGDVVARAQAYATGRQWGWLSVNDIRRLENMNPIPNGDIYLQPVNTIEAGKPYPSATKQNVDQALIEEIYNMVTRKVA